MYPVPLLSKFLAFIKAFTLSEIFLKAFFVFINYLESFPAHLHIPDYLESLFCHVIGQHFQITVKQSF